jgi:hypothetical protein
MREIPEAVTPAGKWPWLGGVVWLAVGMLLGRMLFPVEKIIVKRVEVPVEVSKVPEQVPVREKAEVSVKAAGPVLAGSPWRRLDEGMTEEDVLALLGSPLRKQQIGQTRCYWYYDEGSENAYVDFFLGKVHQYRIPWR